ncbi:MAG: hypothetical protein ACJ768_24495 [Gaiellaceae bacterium]
MRRGTLAWVFAACAIACAPAHAASAPQLGVSITTADQAALRAANAVTAAVTSDRATTVAVAASSGGQALGPAKAVALRRGTQAVSLPLSDAGKALAARCGALSVKVTAGTASASKDLAADPAGCYRMGMAARTISPEANGTWKGAPVYLGGYGFGGPPVQSGRSATGVLGVGPSVRAVSVFDGTHRIALADMEEQGWFAADKNDPYGFTELRKAVEQRSHGQVKAEDVIVQSDHSHGGADTIGVWGGVPVEYRHYMFDQAVAAILDAIANERPGTLYYGTADGADLLSNQFDYDTANKVMDSDVRVLQARDAGGRAFATMLNFSAHATVLGSSNRKITGDWPQEINPMLEQRFGGQAMTVVGTLGRTQPADRGCHDSSLPDGSDAQSLCALDDYAGRVADRTAQAVASAQPIGGKPTIDMKSYLIQDPATSPLILGLDYAGDPVGVPIDRSLTPPWLTGNVLGTVTSTARIGDVLLSAMPGEAYPQIPLKVRELVPHLRGYMTAGLADDQLGYLIYPYTAYPEPIRRSFFNQRGDEVSPIDNDNYFFNVSHTMGARVTCSLLRGAGDVTGNDYRSQDSDCTPFANDTLQPDGADVK